MAEIEQWVIFTGDVEDYVFQYFTFGSSIREIDVFYVKFSAVFQDFVFQYVSFSAEFQNTEEDWVTFTVNVEEVNTWYVGFATDTVDPGVIQYAKFYVTIYGDVEGYFGFVNPIHDILTQWLSFQIDVYNGVDQYIGFVNPIHDILTQWLSFQIEIHDKLDQYVGFGVSLVQEDGVQDYIIYAANVEDYFSRYVGFSVTPQDYLDKYFGIEAYVESDAAEYVGFLLTVKPTIIFDPVGGTYDDWVDLTITVEGAPIQTKITMTGVEPESTDKTFSGEVVSIRRSKVVWVKAVYSADYSYSKKEEYIITIEKGYVLSSDASEVVTMSEGVIWKE